MISISSPTSDSTVSVPFDVTGTCSSQHTVTVKISGTDKQATVTPDTRVRDGWSWAVTFNSCPAGTYTITAECGDPVETATVTNVQVTG
jgi:hypothetical protein